MARGHFVLDEAKLREARYSQAVRGTAVRVNRRSPYSVVPGVPKLRSDIRHLLSRTLRLYVNIHLDLHGHLAGEGCCLQLQRFTAE